MSNRWKGGFVQLYFDPLAVGPITQALYSWGRNQYGGLGREDLSNSSSPIQVGSLLDWSFVSANSSNGQTAFLKTDGTMWMTGHGLYGKQGTNNTINTSSPVQVGALTDWAYVSVGGGMTAAIKTDGTLWTMGYDLSGQLAVNTAFVDKSSPVQVGALTDWAKVTVRGAKMAIKTDGTLWGWGSNNNGRLGTNNPVSTEYSSPIQIGALANWSKVATSPIHFTIATKTDGTLWAWGDNGFYTLGQGDTVDRSSPVQVGALTNWLEIAAGQYHVVAVKTDGTLWSWGRNYEGQCGNNSTVIVTSPIQVGALDTWQTPNAGNQSAVIKTDGSLWIWGVGAFGALGTGNSVSVSSPVQLGSSGESWAIAAMGYGTTYNGLAIKSL